MSNVLDILNKEYFEWLCDWVCRRDCPQDISYMNLLVRLHNTDFEYTHPNDKNRADDGIDLRYRFALYYEKGYSVDFITDMLDGPCSVFEMLIALAIRCDENIMDAPTKGNRIEQWFWMMIVNLDLGGMYGDLFDEEYVDFVIRKFLDRKYEPDGRGGLFRIRNCKYDLREVGIWRQLCWYLDTIEDNGV